MTIQRWLKPILAERQPLEPLKTNLDPSLHQIPGIKAVIFDVYGTLIVSGSGDVGSVDQTDRTSVLRRSFEAAGIDEDFAKGISWHDFRDAVERMNSSRKKDGCESPEVDVVSVWRGLLETRGWIGGSESVEQVIRLATFFEAWANPTWPMPGASDLIQRLYELNFCLGIVSNAQIFTKVLVEDLLISKKINDGSLQPDLCFFSNRFRHSKPGPRLFQALASALQRRGILPQEAVYVGNDMLNDVWAAKQIGMKTAWFAGDLRSARGRAKDSRCTKLSADLILTSLPQLLECLTLSE